MPVTRTSLRLGPDARRVITEVYVPGQEALTVAESPASLVLDRALAMPEDQVEATLEATLARFGSRHRHLEETLEHHFRRAVQRVVEPSSISRARLLLIGAYFTHEYSVEAAALFNPSMVLHPDQSGLAPGEARFVMSLRALGEGHLSSVEFRTGVVGEGGQVHVDDPGPFLMAGGRQEAVYEREVFGDKLADMGDDNEQARLVLDALPDKFTMAELQDALAVSHRELLTRKTALDTSERILEIASANYVVEFPDDSSLAERVLWPTAPHESHGMEDARFVRFVDDDGSVTYYGTYTAFDGAHVAPQLIETKDFCRFTVSQLAGAAAKNKGMALFPRRLGGRFVALSRWDRATTAIVTSDNCRVWGASTTLQQPEQPWELIQIGNCGSPIETPAGWLVITHGVGPMRVYSLGAILLDLDDPGRVIGKLTEPLMSATDDERNGYVPNVLYSCGSLLHGDTLVLPYGMADCAVGVALVELAELLDRLV